jgi:hypothetical protein
MIQYFDMRNKEKRGRGKVLPNPIATSIQFADQEQLDLVKRAAARRGLSFSAFVRWACSGVAIKVMATPAEPALGDLAEIVGVRENAA